MRNVLILLGSPGAGKGTQAKLIRETFKIPKVSTGDMLRSEVAQETALGNLIASRMNAGELISDELVNEAVRRRIQLPDCDRGFILDGYPRSLAQARFLETILNGNDRVLAVEIQADCDELLPRLMSRRYCPDCEAVFSAQDMTSTVGGICSDCGSVLRQRNDDREDVIRGRFHRYLETTSPLIAHYRGRGVFHQVQGGLPVSQVFGRIESIVREMLGLNMPQIA